MGRIRDLIRRNTSRKQRRSPEWRRVRSDFIAIEGNGVCAVCGRDRSLEVHHIVPFHRNPAQELEPANLITLCDGWGPLNCHMIFGHLGNWQAENPTIRRDAPEWSRRFEETRDTMKKRSAWRRALRLSAVVFGLSMWLGCPKDDPPPEPPPFCDFTGDGIVGEDDFTYFRRCFDQSPLTPECERTDLNRDGVVGGPDFIEFAQCFREHAWQHL